MIPTPLPGLEFEPRLETLRYVPDQKDLRRHVQSRIESPWMLGKEISSESRRGNGMANSLDPHFSPSICCGAVSTCVDCLMLPQRSSTYL